MEGPAKARPSPRQPGSSLKKSTGHFINAQPSSEGVKSSILI
jgi:hypothetical protein